MPSKVLLFKDIIPLIPTLRATLSDESVQLLSVLSGDELVLHAKNFQPRVVLFQHEMPNLNGLEVCRQVKEILPDSKIIVFLGGDASNSELGHSYKHMGADAAIAEFKSEDVIASMMLESLGISFEKYVQKLAAGPTEVPARLLERVDGLGIIDFTWRGRDVTTKVENLNLKGILFKSEVQIPIDAEVDLIIQTPLPETLEIKVKIIRVQDNPIANEEKKYLCAAQFIKITESKVQFIENWFQISKKSMEASSELRKGERLNVEKKEFECEIISPVTSSPQIEPINISKQGALFAFREVFPVSSMITLRFSWNGKTLELPSVVVRSSKLKKMFEFGQMGTAVEFQSVSDRDAALVEELIGILKKHQQENQPPAPNVMRVILGAGFEVIYEQVKTGVTVDPWSCIGAISEFEKSHAISSSEYAPIIQRLILARGKCFSFGRFMSSIAEQPSALSGFLEDLRLLLISLDVVEAESDDAIRKAVQEDYQEMRAGLIAQNNRLFETKQKMFFRVTDCIGSHPELGKHATVVDIVKKVVELRASQKNVDYGVKYDRKVEETKPVVEEKKVDKRKTSKGAFIALVICFCIIAVGAFLVLRPRYLSPSDLALPVEVVQIQVVEEGLRITCSADVWKSSSPEKQDGAFLKLEDYLFEHKKKQAKLIDLEGKTLAATVVIVSRLNNERPDFKRRLYY